MTQVVDILLDALIDALKMLPFLFGAYLLMEAAEHASAEKTERFLGRIGKFGPAAGALLGCIPQCGFSASASNLYAAGLITRGTLIAVFLSTSDEAIPVLIGTDGALKTIALIMATKIVYGMAIGFLIDLIMKIRGTKKAHIEICDDCGCDEESGIVKPALRHTLKIFVFILALNILLGAAFAFLGEERISAILLRGSVLQPIVAALVGMIPNCAASVMLTRLYVAGSLGLGSLLSGLCSSAGIGLVVLFRINKCRRENLEILATMYAVSVIPGLILTFLGI